MVQSSKASSVRVSADGEGLVSRAGVALLRELTISTGLGTGWSEALLDTYDGTPVHLPGRVLADLAVMIADGGDALAHLATLRDQDKLFGAVASDATAWRVLDRVDDEHLVRLQTVRTSAREQAWAAGAGPDLAAGLTIDIDATISIAHSEKENAAKTWKKTFGFHPLLAYLDRPDISGGEALAGILRPGKAGSNTAADHVKVLTMALAALPACARPDPDDPDAPRVQVRTDAAGATHAFAAAVRAAGCGFSMGFPISTEVQAAVLAVPDHAWVPAYDIDGGPREGAWVAEITGMLELTKWPDGSRVFLRRERPHPGAQLRFTDADGHRFTAFITDTAGGQLADLEVHHRCHARVEDRIRCGKTTGLRNFPCRGYPENKAWLELALTAADLLTWTQALCFTGDLTRAEPATFRYRICAIAAKLTRTARVTTLHLDQDWPWAQHLATAFTRLRAARWPG
ncbi:IS1380 family transposase [Amycolatopsis balhimycina DSM 5908]|uniref:IS1380 family transposase n=1 Tax=Amycolatopsis balhimycina DSM 5908 TaxID=1081091 RepID=A0A428WMF1_AMYBA|nr:IS1380 family transposase [Amycolatopsis balhimycina]RSM44267.1 IS1380 family transposase [Amycolatopsis balhimycina DSM 5908]